MGNAILILTLFRILWWWRFDTGPKPIGNSPAWPGALAKLEHGLVYLLIVGMAASGSAMIALTGADAVIFDGLIQTLPDFHETLARVPHRAGTGLLLGFPGLHAGAALFHHFGTRDATLQRMSFKKKVSERARLPCVLAAAA